MLAFFKREFKSYFTTMTGYAFLCAFLVITGIYTVAMNLYGAYSTFEYTLSSNLVMLILVIPILTMRLFAEERQKGITPLLSSLPVSTARQVLAKYAACAAIYTLPMLLVCLYPLMLSLYGEINFASAYHGIFGYWLLGLALLGVGMFISSLTATPTVAAVLSFGIFLLFYLSGGIATLIPVGAFASFVCFAVCLLLAAWLLWYLTRSWIVSGAFFLLSETALLVCYLVLGKKMAGSFADLVEWFSVFSRYYSFLNGIFDWTDIFYYLSIGGVGVFLTVLSVDRRRWA
jgi:ABC-2 type transport system permease protein